MDRPEVFSTSLHAPPDVLVQELPDGDSIFLHLGSESYFGLDAVGSTMYRRLVEAGSAADAYERLLGEFDVAPERLRSDLERLVSDLLQRGILRADGPAAG